jgi:hypothetical protein
MEIYNIRVGDLLYRVQDGKPIVGIVYKLTKDYVTYAVCAQLAMGESKAFVTKGHRISKSKLYKSLSTDVFEVSYAGGISRRRKVSVNNL